MQFIIGSKMFGLSERTFETREEAEKAKNNMEKVTKENGFNDIFVVFEVV